VSAACFYCVFAENRSCETHRGQAVFFSYYDAAKNVTDNGHTRHSGCPIVEGSKVIMITE
jgi:hypothetical protein